jgi:hypothetical protein
MPLLLGDQVICEYYLLGCDAVESGKSSITFQRNLHLQGKMPKQLTCKKQAACRTLLLD